MNSLVAQDATMYWLSARTRNDLFLLYCFADTGRDAGRLRSAVANRVARIPDLLIRVLDTPANIAYPLWATCEFTSDQFLDHDLGDVNWVNLTDELGILLGTGLRAQDRPWRLHIFRNVRDVPGFAAEESALVAVLQLSHALADGRRAAAIARALFGAGELPAASAPPPAPFPLRYLPSRVRDAATGALAATLALPAIPISMARTVIRGLAAARAQRHLADLTAAGELPPPALDVEPTLLNGAGAPPERHIARILLCDKARLRTPGHSVTVVALTAISFALERYLRDHDAPVPALRAQVPMAITAPATDGPNRPARNAYRDLSVDLSHTEPQPRTRADRIAADLTARRTRASHPLQHAPDAVTAVLPAPLLHRDVTNAPLDSLPDRVSGHTVVSSVDRGPADLEFDGAPVRFTAGFPALGAVMHLTHGVTGLGDTVTISIHADPAVIPDPDHYLELLESALDEVARALR